LLAALAVVVLPIAACSSPPEQQLIQKYFAASRMRDNATLQNFATVSFSPTTEGVVQKFTITSVGEETRKALKLRELSEAEAALRKEEEAFNKRKKEYQDENSDAIQRVLKAEAARQTLKGKDLQTQTEWQKWRDETAAFAKKLTDAHKALNADRGLTEVSVFDARNQVDVVKYDGELISKDVHIDAEVKAPDGTVSTKKLHLTLTRAELTNGPEGKTASGRWVITQIGGDVAPAS
jgi:hypothetical protein